MRIFGRRLKFSLRLMLLFVTVFCVWLGLQVRHAKLQRLAVERIAQLGGEVDYAYEYDDVVGVRRSADPRPPGPKWLRTLIGDDYFLQVVGVDLGRTPVVDADLEHLANLPHIERLDLEHTMISDNGACRTKSIWDSSNRRRAHAAQKKPSDVQHQVTFCEAWLGIH